MTAPATRRVGPGLDQTDLLLPCERSARGPLRDRAARWTAALADAGNDPADLVRALNQVALVFADAGDRATAAEICLRQLDLCADHHARTGDARIVALALQPFVNVGRLRALDRDWTAAMAHFGIASAMTAGTPLCLGPLRVDDWSAVRDSTPDVLSVAAAIEISEVTKTLLRAGRAGELGPRLAGWLADPALRGQPLLHEARLVHGTRLGRWQQVDRLATWATGHSNGHARRAFTWYRVLAAAHGGTDRAGTVAAALDLAGKATTATDGATYDTARLLAHLSRLLDHVGAHAGAAGLAWSAADLAEAGPDEPLSARLLLDLDILVEGDTAAMAQVAARCRALCARSDYAEVRHRLHDRFGCVAHHAPPSFLDPLTSRLAAW